MALGRGLGDILSEVEEAYAKDLSSIDSSELEAQGARVAEIDVSSISPNPFQPRKHFDEKALQELSDSIREHGLLQPIVVIEKGDDYMLIAGERRLRAHKLANLSSVKAIIADVDIDEIRLRELALIENIQRENLNPIELANSYAELIEVHGIRHEDLSDIVHKSRSQITNTMRLLTLSEYAKDQLAEGNISQGHAKVLVGLDAPKQKVIIDSIVGQKLSVREAENIVKNYKNDNSSQSKKVPKISLLDEYKEALNAVLPFKHKVKSKSVEISFTSAEEIENFLSILKKA
ncbi:ParB/RepB/Spo0J family partition protein [Sulfurovum mangrovi]|uniref:ParB/RepB/Spo0J family partition protein n=1 Tax=Sulfurovum mangrovi TaxID=2893889 RepID=UPI001E5FDA75|nr:ParB/RepB/Spo0J family partition protein [Sulfurovum mangrovi]UFH58686.1 ParB/RepB/Spo0J family partition protein [Sulfurovum mangrovi]